MAFPTIGVCIVFQLEYTMPGTIFWKATLLFTRLVLASNSVYDLKSEITYPDLLHQQSSGNLTQSCSLDQSKPPGNLTSCGNSTLFSVWRPKARFIAPEGWMNDPQGKSSVAFQFVD